MEGFDLMLLVYEKLLREGHIERIDKVDQWAHLSKQDLKREIDAMVQEGEEADESSGE